MEWAFALLIYANASRATPLIEDPWMSAVATNRAEYLCLVEFSHDNWTRWAGMVPGASRLGENLARNYERPADAHSALMDSPTHRANIENASYRRIGIGHAECAEGSVSRSVSVELFAD